MVQFVYQGSGGEVFRRGCRHYALLGKSVLENYELQQRVESESRVIFFFSWHQTGVPHNTNTLKNGVVFLTKKPL